MVQPSETPLSAEDIARAKESAELRAVAFRSQIELVIRQIDRLAGLKFDPEIGPGIPDSEELERLLKLGDAIAFCRGKLIIHDDALCTLLAQYTSYCCGLPGITETTNALLKECTDFCASTRLLDIQDALKQKQDNLQQLIDACGANARILRKRIADAAAADTATQFGDTEHSSSSTQQPKTGSTAGSAKDGGIPPHSSPFRAGGTRSSRTEPGDTASLMAHFRALGSSHSQPSTSRPRSPLRYTADGTPTPAGPFATDTGADFSPYGSNPFYTNSSIKLPLKSSAGTPTGKEPAPPSLTLSALPIKPFDGDQRQYPRFRDAFIRMVHALDVTLRMPTFSTTFFTA